ncbi:hypothetical protein AB0N07_08460 [Streptomyces sp. NPDC051172]|uniref:hypothetical protein n=1 Tax=Streptomyces sp. NPDC051172 TaxID=3155796 RepID=UPI00342AC27F
MGNVIFFQLTGAILQFGISRLAQTRLGLVGLGGALVLTLAPVLIRRVVVWLRRTIHSHPQWWAFGLLVTLLALCVHG